jgi:hypothetical protein
MRSEFKMTTQQFKTLKESFKPVPMIMLQCGNPQSQQENANDAWRNLGDEMGFIWDTARPCGKGPLYFTAENK